MSKYKRKVRVSVYVSGDKESAYDAGKSCGLSDEQLSRFQHATTDHNMIFDVDEFGNGKLIAVDGFVLSEVKL